MKVRFDPRRTLLFRLQHSAVVSVQTNRSAPAIALGASHQSSRGSARCSKPVLAGSVGRFRMPGKSHRSAWPFATAGAPEPGRTTGRAGVVWTVVTDEVQIAVRAQTEPPGSADRRYQGSCAGNPMTDIAFDARAETFFLNCPPVRLERGGEIALDGDQALSALSWTRTHPRRAVQLFVARRGAVRRGSAPTSSGWTQRTPWRSAQESTG